MKSSMSPLPADIPSRLSTAIAFLCAATTITTAAAPQSNSGAMPSQPNIVLIIADDIGYGDLGYMGCEAIDTPNIDRLAELGVECTDAYMTAPQCAPARAAVLTGIYQQRFGYERIAPAHTNGGLPEDREIIPEYLHSAGYISGMVGKWHLGYLESQHPLNRGFDDLYGFIHGSHDYYVTNPNAPVTSYRAPLQDGSEKVIFNGYLTDDLAQAAVDFITTNKDKPFFLYAPFNAPHTPHHTPPEQYMDRIGKTSSTKRAEHLAMIVALDDAVGRIVETLEQEGIAENTLIIFTNDNGGVSNKEVASNGVLRGGKGMLFEGGIRVPWIFYWPGTLSPHTYSQPITGVDIAPTILDLAAVPIPADMDGVSLWPSIANGAPLDRKYLYWRFKFRGRVQGAVRKGDWKYYMVDRDVEPSRYGEIKPGEYLFNLGDDISERRDLAQKNPEIFQELQAAYRAWDSELADPAWPSD